MKKIPCEVNNFAVIKYGEAAIKDLSDFMAKELPPYYNAHIVDITDDHIEVAGCSDIDLLFDRVTGKAIKFDGCNPYYIDDSISVIVESYTYNTPLHFIEDPKDVFENWRIFDVKKNRLINVLELNLAKYSAELAKISLAGMQGAIAVRQFRLILLAGKIYLQVK